MILRRSLALVALVGLLCTLLASCSFELDYDRYAIVYGISDYPGTEVDLDYADDDAVALAAVLDQQGYVGPGGVPLVARVDIAATKQNLVDDLNALALSATPITEDDLLVVYYAGHGGQGSADLAVGTETAAGADPYEEWIFLHDSIVYVDNPPAGPDPNDDYLTDLTQTVNDDELASLLRSVPCRMKVLIIDACNSGGFVGNQLEHDGTPADYDGSSDSFLTGLVQAISLYGPFDGNGSDVAPQNALVLAAAGEREESIEGYYGHGVFTYFLLDAPTRGDANLDDFVTVGDAYRYVRQHLDARWNVWVSESLRFAPHVSGGPVDYVLFSSKW